MGGKDLITTAHMGGILMTEFNIVSSDINSGLSVIEASAGTGKTYAISRLVPRLLLDPEIGVDHLSEILLVTYTNDAARELSERVRKSLEKLLDAPEEDEALKDPASHEIREKFTQIRGAKEFRKIITDALIQIDQLNVSTIHSFCQKTLQTEGALCGLPVIPELNTDTREVALEILEDLWEERIASSDAMATLVSDAGLSLDSTLNFIVTALPLQDPVMVPEAIGFDKKIKMIAAFADQFTPQVCGALREILIEVSEKGWKKNSPDEESRTSILSVLEGATSTMVANNMAEAVAFFDATRDLSDAASWMKAQGRAAQAIKAATESSAAVSIAKLITPIINSLGWELQNDFFKSVRKKTTETLQACRQITYDGLIEKLQSSLKGSNGDLLIDRLRKRYRIALIDECQDTDPRQYDIFSTIFLGPDPYKVISDHRLLLIGDPKQAIYSFRGADVNTYLAARNRPNVHLFVLTKTFRAPEPLVQAINAFFSRKESLLKKDLPFVPASSGLPDDIVLSVSGKPSPSRIDVIVSTESDELDYHGANSQIAENVATEIVLLLNAGAQIVHSSDKENPKDVLPGDFAVLVSDNSQAAAMEEALKSRNIPAVRAGSDDVMASEEAADLLAILKALLDPRRKSLRFPALATRLMGRTDADLRALDVSEDDMITDFLRWQKILLTKGVAAAISSIDRDQGISIRGALGEMGDRRVTNLRQLTDLLQAAFLEQGGHAGRLLRWFNQEIMRAGSKSELDERQLQLESDADAVRIVTMHKAKGLEYPLVFCPFLWSIRKITKGVKKLSKTGDHLGTIPMPHLVNLDLPEGAEYISEINRMELEDRLRLAYVAITRARVKVWIHAGNFCGNKSASALDWLLRTATPSPEDSENPPVSDGELNLEDWGNEYSNLDPAERHSKGLEEMIQSTNSRDLISSYSPSKAAPICWSKKDGPVIRDLEALPSPTVPPPWRMTSFSSLTREKDPHWGQALATTALPIEANNQEKDDTPPSPPTNSFFDAAGGAVVGTAIHDWIEGWDFKHVDEVKLKAHLEGYTIPEPWEEKPDRKPFDESVAGMLEELRQATLPGLGCTIAEACSEAAASEWHFQLPISQEEPLSPQRIAGIFAKQSDAVSQAYSKMLLDLKADELTGFLHGFIDRLTFHSGVWGVVDWKTNGLGGKVSDYSSESLRECALQSHYFLQTHLYLVALRRYLGPKATIAGAWLVFLRGITAGTDRGILRINPAHSLLDDLDSLFFRPLRPVVPIA